jgi:putative membrane protein
MADPRRPGPVIIDLDETPLPDAPAPHEAPPVPDPEDDPGRSARTALRTAARGTGGAARLVWPALVGLLTLMIGVGVHDFLADLFARTPWLGWLGLALTAVVVWAVLAALLRELAALARLGRVDRIRALVTVAASGDPAQARQVSDALCTLYAHRPALASALDHVRRMSVEQTDGPAILALNERMLMPALDAGAGQAVRRGAQTVAAATALLPMTVLDVLIVLGANIRMIRGIAEVYGGRAGWLGSVRLLRAVAGHLVATGAISATDDLLGPVLGGGMMARVSRRFGEAAVNAGLTARVGVAAMEVCRPLPFVERAPPRASALLFQALRRWREPSET